MTSIFDNTDQDFDTDQIDSRGNTQLHHIISYNHGHFPTVKKLIVEKGIDINSLNSNGYSALHLSIICCKNIDNRIRLVKFLIKNGADIKQLTACGSLSIHMTLEMEHLNEIERIEICKILLKDVCNSTSIFKKSIIHSCVIYERLSILKLLVEDINSTDIFGNTQLHTSIKFKDSEKIIKILLEHGADINFPNNCGDTPLHFIFRYSNNLEINKLLLNKTANLNIPNNHGYTPLDVCYKSKFIFNSHNFSWLKLLVEKGLNINFKKQGDTVLTTSVKNNNLIATSYLLHKGAIFYDQLWSHGNYKMKDFILERKRIIVREIILILDKKIKNNDIVNYISQFIFPKLI